MSLPVWPILPCLASVFLVARLPVFRAVEGPATAGAGRLSSLDGLRGVLALAVVVHHAALYRDWQLTGRWGALSSRALLDLGPAAVALFFMITGCLFWTILLAQGGRPRWGSLLVGRVFRIAPLYLVAVSAMFVLVGLSTGFRLRVPAPVLVREVLDWLALGAHGPVPLDGVDTTMFLGSAWSLHYEWLFYAALPLLGLLARRAGTAMPLLLAVLAVLLVADAVRHGPVATVPTPIVLSLFLFGMLAASLLREGREIGRHRTAGSVAAGLLVCLALRTPEVYATLGTVLLGLAFCLLIAGADMFGMLATGAARRVGQASYGIYLLHLLVLRAACHVPALRHAFLAGPLAFWSATTALLLATFAVAAAAHLAVERPGIAAGRVVIGAARSRAARLRGAPARRGLGQASTS